jgi:hypothetical protein
MKKLIDIINTDNEPNILNDMVFGSGGVKRNNMKNLHTLSTDKPSRLLFDKEENRLLPLQEVDFWMEHQNLMENQHIYIASDEEIKEEDWCYYLNSLGGGNIVCQAYKHSEDKRMLFDKGTHNREIGEGITPLSGECKKIILTTDQDLVKDGVQAIDDEFLEWFVKNPSCEFVEYNKNYNRGNGKYYYKIIIPTEEPKQLNNFGLPQFGTKEFNDLASQFFGGKPKQETLEEAAERRYPNRDDLHLKREFKAGAKWQQEDMIEKLEMHILINEDDWNRNPQAQFRNFIEQFKKK